MHMSPHDLQVFTIGCQQPRMRAGAVLVWQMLQERERGNHSRRPFCALYVSVFPTTIRSFCCWLDMKPPVGELAIQMSAAFSDISILFGTDR